MVATTTHPACSTRTGQARRARSPHHAARRRSAPRGRPWRRRHFLGTARKHRRNRQRCCRLPFLVTCVGRSARRRPALLRPPPKPPGATDQQIRELLATHLKVPGSPPALANLPSWRTSPSPAPSTAGGERAAQTAIFEYWVPASAFGTEPHYVALGHLHRRQTLPASTRPVAYSGSPICVDFGEQDNTPVVVLVDATPSTPARTTDLPLIAGTSPAYEPSAAPGRRPRRPCRGPRRRVPAGSTSPNPPAPGYAKTSSSRRCRTRSRSVSIRSSPRAASTGRAAPRPDRSPSELFGDYCAQHGVDDARVRALFDELHDTVTSPAEAALGTGTGS